MVRTRRRLVLLLLLLGLTVLSPLALYTSRLSVALNSIQARVFPGEITNQGRGVKADKLNALPLQTVSSLKEPVDIVFSEELTESKSQELRLPKVGAHKSRVLSEVTVADDDTSSKDNEVIEQVITLEAQDGGLVKGAGVSDEQEKNIGSLQQSSSEESSQDTMPKQTPAKVVAENSQSARTDGKTKTTVLPDMRIRNIKDQLIKAKVYLGLGSIRASSQYLKDLRQRIREVQKVLGDASKDSDLPKNAHEKVKALEQMLIKGKQMQDDCSIIVKKLRAMLHSAEEQLHAHKKQTVFLTQLAAKTLPKGLHCLPLRLANEYFSLDPVRQQFPNQQNLINPKLYHYALFSDNILATAVVVNSTVLNAKHPSDHVIHIVTDKLNYAPMRMWFLSNPPGKATIEVQNIEEFTWLNDSYSPVLKHLGSQSMIDYYFGTNRANSDSNLKYRNPKYLSILNHLRFYLPEIYPKLDKMVFLDDDIVVKKDLAGLWSINMKGKVNGAVETCGESFHRYDRYLNFSNPIITKSFDPHACVWAFGMNVFDLAEWRRQNITEIYHSWQKLNEDRSLWKLGTLPPGLVTFWNKTFPLSRSWHVLGLGYNPHVNSRDIEHAAVIHYNGNMKPWLEIGLPKFRSYWSKYLDYDQSFLRECNINP
ncbi:Probable galacturonosyltransferase 4 isoform 2 [Zea mays]|uniref:Hexosyltransferase n=1 Tax=Zea mays TaxID=4577 RepID=C0PAL8_MAIZE|nr:Probable galacturonosyltransferase 4 isoform 2 [Zea mays]ACN31213.1 unknown [Zea mays]AQK50043.1 putative galacturonosyltransferase 4 [Zea mays]|eukprot:XP_008677252.1 transferase, transferring glycosyl groups isoform X1 [Zea mays]